MSQLLLNKRSKLAGFIAMLVVFFASMVDASAQSRASTDLNPQSQLAVRLGVNPCGIGTATNVQGGLDAIDALAASLKPTLANASVDNKLRYAYYASISADARNLDIAVEITLLSSLRKAVTDTGIDNVTTQQLVTMYNSTKSLFGMCQ